ncbi:MAG: ATP-binding protein [Leptolyngbya sp. RL_3_1]|nr:ATP-binding protein [Leptolyngbya sp. RL_3_1]
MPESPAGAPADITAVIKQHLDAPVVAVVGPQGVGKSTFLHWLYGQIPGAAIALDPHAAKGDHAGLVVVGAGMDYEAIDGAVTQVRELVEERYRARAQGTTTFPKLLVVVEELTNWADKVGSAKALIKEALSDFRKANVQLVLVAHGKTNALMGGSDGMAALRQSGMLLLEISEKGKGTLTIPGDQRRAMAVSIPLLQGQPVTRPGLPFRLGDGAIVTPPADTPQAKVIRHLENCPDGIPQGALIQKVSELKTMSKDAAVIFLTRMALEGQIRSETTDQSVRYFTA